MAVTAPDLCIVAASEWVLVHLAYTRMPTATPLLALRGFVGWGGLKSLVWG